MCQKCTRSRFFLKKDLNNDDYNRGQIDLLCLKKFHIRELVLSAEEEQRIVGLGIKKKQESMKKANELRMGELSEDPVYT